MTKIESENENILRRLEVFRRLERKATDEVGWIALAFGCSRGKANRLINRAQAAAAKAAPATPEAT